MCNPFRFIGNVVRNIFGGGDDNSDDLAAAVQAANRARELAAPDPEAQQRRQTLRLRRLLARRGQGQTFGGVGGNTANVAVKRLLGAGGS